MTWIFGYGSIVYKPGFEYKRKVHGYIKGYRRVWWQGSTDHRGTPEHPGRTVTLQEDAEAVTWGVAYELAGTEEEQQQYIAYLEWREKQYDIRKLCDVHVAGDIGSSSSSSGSMAGRQQFSAVIPNCLVYIASQSANNQNYLGPAPLDSIAQQIAAARGPSGHNHEYLFKLAAAMREMDVEDAELFQLEALVRQIMSTQSTTGTICSSPLLQQGPQVAVAAAEAVAIAAAVGQAASEAAGCLCAMQQGGTVQQTMRLLATTKGSQQQSNSIQLAAVANAGG